MWGHCSVGYGAKVTGFLSLNVLLGLNGTDLMLGFVSFCFKVVYIENVGCSERIKCSLVLKEQILEEKKIQGTIYRSNVSSKVFLKS